MRRMGSLTVVALAAALGVCGASRGQDAPPSGPGPEMKKLEFLLGKRTAKGKLFPPGQAPMEWTATDQSEWGPGGYSIRSEAKTDYGGNLKDTSLTVMSYDAGEKLYKCYRFSSLEPAPIEASGKFDGDKLVMMIKPDVTGLIYRITFAPKSKTESVFLLEQKKGDRFEKFIEGVYTR
jgi:hypothetical protein